MTLGRRLAVKLATAHPEQAARILESMPLGEATATFAGLPLDAAVEVLPRMHLAAAGACLAACSEQHAADLLGRLRQRDGARLLQGFPADQRERLLEVVPAGVARPLRRLLRYREDTAGGLMDPDVLALPENMVVREARRQAKQLQWLYVIEDHLIRLRGCVVKLIDDHDVEVVRWE